MANPKKRTSTRKRNQRRSHHALKSAHLMTCNNCGELKLRHHVCPSCGFYRGKQIIEVEAS
ncbi:MAG: 50S ribosomal protein L32 [Myxococcota bacterium]